LIFGFVDHAIKFVGMRSNLLLSFFLLFSSTICFAQVSIGAGPIIPIRTFETHDNSAVKLGYQITASYDKTLYERCGISAGILLGQSSVSAFSADGRNGLGSYALVEVGLLVTPTERVKVKSLFTFGLYSSPEFEFEYTTASFNSTSAGLDLKLEYSFNKIFIGSSLLFTQVNFESGSGDPLLLNDVPITNLGFLVGYNF